MILKNLKPFDKQRFFYYHEDTDLFKSNIIIFSLISPVSVFSTGIPCIKNIEQKICAYYNCIRRNHYEDFIVSFFSCLSGIYMGALPGLHTGGGGRRF